MRLHMDPRTLGGYLSFRVRILNQDLESGSRVRILSQDFESGSRVRIWSQDLESGFVVKISSQDFDSRPPVLSIFQETFKCKIVHFRS